MQLLVQNSCEGFQWKANKVGKYVKIQRKNCCIKDFPSSRMKNYVKELVQSFILLTHIIFIPAGMNGFS